MKKLLFILPLLLWVGCEEEQEPEDDAFEIVFTAGDGVITPMLGSELPIIFYSPTAYLLYNIETYASIRPHQRVWIHHYINYSLNATHSMTIDEWTVRWDSTYINSTLNLPSGENNFTPVQLHYSEAPQEHIPITSSFNLSIAHDNNEMGYVATDRGFTPDTTYDYVYIPLIHAILDEYNSGDLPFSISINGNYEKNIGESVGFEYIYSDTFSVLIDTVYSN
jgi:hypothetical protein|tara:strand:+ start:57 stop:722 length:666 start_codon:yes stop_codon:yes gene_type:complete